MNEPRLLRQRASSGFERALLESARADRAPDGGEELALAALGLGAVAAAVAVPGVSTPPAAVAASKIATAVLFKWSGIGLAVTVAVSAPLAYVLVSRTETSSVAPPSRVAPPALEAAEPHAGPPVIIATPPTPPLPPRPVEPAPPPTASVAVRVATASAALPSSVAEPRIVPPAPARSVSSLSPELDILDRARKAVAAHDAAGARAALDEYQRRFPRGLLREEAEVASIETLLLSGDSAGTRDAANGFLAAHPDSPYAGRVRAISRRASNP